jgi:hypothetical protein
MSDKKISQLTTVTASQMDGTELIPMVHSGTTKKATLEEAQHFIVNHLTPDSLTVSSGQTVDLNASTYDETEMLVLSWSGGNGTMILTLPDATEAKNLNRVKRIITDSTFVAATKARLTPFGSQNLDGVNSYYEINKAYEGIQVWSNGIEWFIIQKKSS